MAKSKQDSLARQVEKLKEENTHLKDELHRRPRFQPSFWRTLGVGICVLLAALTLIIGNVAFWAGNTLVNTQKYVQTVQPILEDRAVQHAIADYTTTKLFNQVDVTGTIQNVLPPRADFLAPALTTQLKGATDITLQRVLGSDQFQTVWVNTNRTAHDKLISSIKNSKGDGVVNLQDVYDSLSQNLQGTKLSFLVGKSLPSKVGTITVINAPWVPKARFVVNSVSWLKPLSLLLIALFSAAAIALARRRRLTVIVLGVTAMLAMLSTLIAIQLVQHTFVLKAAPAYQTAADHAAGIIFHPLFVKSLAILLFGGFVSIIAWLGGAYRPAAYIRQKTRQWLTGPIHGLIFAKDNDVTKWAQEQRITLEYAVLAILAIVCLVREISPKMVVASAVLALIIVLAIETIAAPHSHRQR